MNKTLLTLVCLFLLSFFACDSPKPQKETRKKDTQLENYAPVCSVHVDVDDDTTQLHVNQRTHVFRSGETLWNLCRTYYGNRHYSSIVTLYNDIEDVNRIKDSTLIKVPALDTLLKDEQLGLIQAIPEEIDLLIEARELFMKHEKQLFEIRGEKEKGTRLDLSETTVIDLKEAQNNIETTIDQMNILHDSIRPPQKVINQLRQVAKNVNQLSQGQHDGPYGYDLDMFHQNLINAIKYLIIWKRNEQEIL